MAVSVKCNGDIYRKAQKSIDMKSPCKSVTSGSSERVREEFTDEDRRRRKKERKKPEMQIYRPGMGLQHKNSTTREECPKSSSELAVSERTTPRSNESKSGTSEKLSPRNRTVDESVHDRLTPPQDQSEETAVKKNAKNRRPDLEVYTPKPRITAMLKGITEPESEQSLKQPRGEKAAKDRVPHTEKATDIKTEDVVLRCAADMRGDHSKKSSKERRFIEVNGDIREKNLDSSSSKSLNSRSTPEGICEEKSTVKSEGTRSIHAPLCHSKVKGDDRDSYKKEKRPSTPRNIPSKRISSPENTKESKPKSGSRYEDECRPASKQSENSILQSDHISWAISEDDWSALEGNSKTNRKDHSDTRGSRKYSVELKENKSDATSKENTGFISSPVAEKSTCELSTDKTRAKNNHSRNCISGPERERVFVRSKNMEDVHKETRERKTSEKSDHAQSSSGSNCEDRDKHTRKNKQARRDDLPPRFQKQNQVRSTASETSGHVLDTSSEKLDVKGAGGILRLPPEAFVSDRDHIPIEKPCQSSHIPVQYPSQPQHFIHKQLFNPKNPSAPEIINIPTPAPYFPSRSPPIDYVHDDDYFRPSYIHEPSRNISEGYIPPPQPSSSSIRSPYHYQNGDFPPLGDISRGSSPQFGGVGSGGLSPPILQGVRPIVPVIQPLVYAPPFIHQAAEQEKKRLKPIVEKNLKEINLLERDISSCLSKGCSVANLNSLRQMRWKLQLRYENIILADPRYCAEKNAEQQLWKVAYYQIIEMLRKSLEEQPDNKELQENLLNIVHEGTVFYENLLEKQQETFGFDLSKLLDVEDQSNQCLYDSLRLILISCQKILIYLGDLARYKEQASGTSNFGKARSWYMKAQQLVPKNGRPYHQLAVLALCTRRKLDAVYYFMRSLAASNPFLSAREYLLSLFEDAKKKYEQYEKKRQEEKSSEEVTRVSLGERCEVWVKPDGSSTQQDSLFDEEEKEEQEFKKLSNVELNKRFITSFLHVHGKLYTKVGMETFNEIVSQMLKEFYHLLQRSPFPLESLRLLQLTIINMFAVANACVKEPCFNGHENSLMLVQALGITQAMMALVMQRCCALHKTHVLSSKYPKQIFSDDMEILVPTIKVWTDWMSCQRHLWSQFPSPSNYSPSFGCWCKYHLSDLMHVEGEVEYLTLKSLVSEKPGVQVHTEELKNIGLLSNILDCFDLDIWESFADLLTVLKDADTGTPELVFERKEGLEPVMLEEDQVLGGFVPLMAAPREPCYAQPPFDKGRAKDVLRISKIQFFGDYLCGIPTPYLEFDVQCKKFRSLVFLCNENDLNKSGSDLWESSKEDSFVEDSLDSDEMLLQSSPNSDGNSEIKLLWSKKEALSRAKAKQEKYNARMQAVLQKNQMQNPIVLHIEPKYLVPDTNCFIDYLPQLKDVLSMGSFNLIVPLIVINELDGLACGTRENPHSTPEHANKVTVQSREAVLFLEKEFASRNPRLRVITSKGSVLDTISFRAEERGSKKVGTNDDFILSCCLYYCKDRPENYMPKKHGDPVRLEREVVLLTDDRHLRVKALTRNVPARDLQSFLEWVNS